MGDYIKDKSGDVIGHNVKIKVIKNKVDVPFREASFPLIYGQGVDNIDEIAQVAVLAGFVQRAGAWFRIIDTETGEIMEKDGMELKFQGQPALVSFLHENPDISSMLESKIRGEEIELPEGEPVDEESYDVV